MRRLRSLSVSAATTLLLAACGTPRPTAPSRDASATPPSSSPSLPPVAGVTPVPVPRSTLASEQVRLAELFRGTPVVFAMQQDGSLRATVPRRFSFDAGASQVKPPLAAVLDRLAKSQLQTGSRMRVSAPADPPADPKTRSGTLGRERALSARDHLVGQGIATARLDATVAAQTDQMEIVVSEAR